MISGKYRDVLFNLFNIFRSIMWSIVQFKDLGEKLIIDIIPSSWLRKEFGLDKSFFPNSIKGAAIRKMVLECHPPDEDWPLYDKIIVSSIGMIYFIFVMKFLCLIYYPQVNMTEPLITVQN